MCERKIALIGNYFSKDGLTMIHTEELIDVALKEFLMSAFLLRWQNNSVGICYISVTKVFHVLFGNLNIITLELRVERWCCKI